MSSGLGPASIHPTAEIEPGATLGAGTRVWARAHVRSGASVGEECVLGNGVFVDAGVRVGSRCKLQNNALVYHGAEVEDEVFIGPAACLTNDRAPRAATREGRLKTDADWEVAGVRVLRGASVGAHAVVIGGVTVGRWAMVGAGAVVTSDVLDHALVVGVPASQAGWACRCGRRLNEDLTCASCRSVYVRGAAGLALAE